MSLDELQKENRAIVKHLKSNGVKDAGAGDDDFSTVMTSTDIEKVRAALKNYPNDVVIRESFGSGCHIIYPKR